MGDEEEMCAFEESILALEKHCAQYNSLKEEVILDIVKGRKPQVEKTGDTIVFSVTGKPIVPRSPNQLKLVQEYEKNDMLFAIGPAGSGKTYTAIALAVRSLKNKEIKKIILSRPAVEAGEKLGFLPGDMKDKIDPYLQPLYPHPHGDEHQNDCYGRYDANRFAVIANFGTGAGLEDSERGKRHQFYRTE